LRVATHHSLKYLFGDFCAVQLKLKMLLSAQRCACAQVAALAAWFHATSGTKKP